MRYLAIIFSLIISPTHLIIAQHSEDTILLKYFAKAGYENLSKVSTFMYHCKTSNMINANMFSTGKNESESILFLKNLPNEVLLRNEIKDTTTIEERKHIVFLKNNGNCTISYIKNNTIYHFSTRTNYRIDNLTKGYGPGTFMICLGIYEAYKSKKLVFQGTGIFKESDCYKYSFDNDDFTIQLYFDIQTSILKGSKFQEYILNIDGINSFKRVFENYIEIDGILIPTMVTVYKNEKFWYSITTKEVKFNVPLENELFYDALNKSEYSFY